MSFYSALILINALTFCLGIIADVLHPYATLILVLSIVSILGILVGISLFWKYRKKSTRLQEEELATIQDWNRRPCNDAEIISASAETNENVETAEYLSTNFVVNSQQPVQEIDKLTEYVSIADIQTSSRTYNDEQESDGYLSPRSIIFCPNPALDNKRVHDSTNDLRESKKPNDFENDNSINDYAQIRHSTQSMTLTCNDDTDETDYARPISINPYHSLADRDVLRTNYSGYTGIKATNGTPEEKHATGSTA